MKKSLFTYAMDLMKKRPAPAFCSVPPSLFVVPVTPGIRANFIASLSVSASYD